MKNLKLRGKLVISFLIVILVSTFPIVLSLNRLKVAEEQSSEAINQYGFTQGDIGNAMLALSQSNTDLHDMVSFENKEHLKKLKEKREKDLNKYEKYIEIIKKNVKNENIKDIYEDAVGCTQEYLDISEDVYERCSKLDTTNEEDYALIEKMLFEELEPSFKTAWGDWTNLLNNLVTKGNKQSKEISHVNTLAYIMYIFCIIYCKENS